MLELAWLNLSHVVLTLVRLQIVSKQNVQLYAEISRLDFGAKGTLIFN